MSSQPITTPLFTQHSRSWRENRYVYPVISRRSGGLSIGVNLNPDKVCNFDCIYCSVDRKEPAVVKEVDLPILEAELRHMIQLGHSGALFDVPPFDTTPQPLKRVNDVAFSGDGEPTSYGQFLDVCKLSARLLDEAVSAGMPSAAQTKLVVITNATLFHRPAVAQALDFLTHSGRGEIWAKLDAGTEPYYRLVERTSIPLRRVLDNIILAARQRPLVIQSLFMNVQGVPPSAQEIQEYVKRLCEIRDASGGTGGGGGGDAGQIKLVQVYTVARQPAESYVSPLSRKQVDDIVALVQAQGFHALPFYGPN